LRLQLVHLRLQRGGHRRGARGGGLPSLQGLRQRLRARRALARTALQHRPLLQQRALVRLQRDDDVAELRHVRWFRRHFNLFRR